VPLLIEEQPANKAAAVRAIAVIFIGIDFRYCVIGLLLALYITADWPNWRRNWLWLS
jgi:hypothetical protein